jgi:hypothetical protein
MADTVESLQAQLDKLNAARAQGVSVVSYVANGTSRSVTYKSDIEMNAAAQDLLRRIAALQSGGGRAVKISSSKGLDHYGH